MDWEDLRDDLASLRDQDLPPGSLAHVRARVHEQLDRRRRRWLAVAVAAPVLLAALVLGVALRNPALDTKLPTVAVVAPPVTIAQARPPETVTRRPASRHAAPAKPRLVAETKFVTLMTDDPDVVILWAMDSRGDAQ
jgi:hypothetical protein